MVCPGWNRGELDARCVADPQIGAGRRGTDGANVLRHSISHARVRDSDRAHCSALRGLTSTDPGRGLGHAGMCDRWFAGLWHSAAGAAATAPAPEVRKQQILPEGYALVQEIALLDSGGCGIFPDAILSFQIYQHFLWLSTVEVPVGNHRRPCTEVLCYCHSGLHTETAAVDILSRGRATAVNICVQQIAEPLDVSSGDQRSSGPN